MSVNLPAAAAASAIRVLIVEDSDADAQVLQALLHYYGCESTRVKRLSHALDALRAGSHDVVLLDLGLPDSGGLPTLERLLEETMRSVPVVILTGANDEAVATAAVAAGAQDYLLKGLTDGRTLVRSIQYARERHRSEQRLRASEERFRALVEKSADGVALIDRSRIVLYTSPAITRLLGWRVEEFQGRDVLTFVHEDDREEARQSFDAVLTGALQTQLTERRYLCRDGGWRIIEVTRTNRLADPAVGAVVINYRDVTEKRRLEEQVAQGQRVASLGRVAASVAHEFNNVLMGTQPLADVIRKRADDEQVRTAAERILEHTRRGARLTTQILRYTNPAEPLFEALDLGAWVRSFDDEWQNLVPGRSLHVDTGEPLVVRADPMQLHQVVTNLLVNARDATPAGGAIRIGAARSTSDPVITRTIPDAERFATLYVCDDGCGIEPAVQERLFEPLFTTKRRGGTGLGLAIAHQIVTEHGGRMLVESEPGRGACFHVVLPTFREA